MLRAVRSAFHFSPSKHWEKESSSVTRGPNRLAALQLSELASNWADSICLTFTVWHMEPWAGNKVFGLAHVHLKNSVPDCWPALKYLVLITATTFTLAGYCWNIIPKGLHCKGITPLFSHRRDGSHSFSQAGFFLSEIWDIATTDYIGCLWQRAIENCEMRDTP